MVHDFARKLIDTVTRWVGWVRKNQCVSFPEVAPIKVNLGCGLSVAPGWINIDGSLNALAANMPSSLQKIAYKMSGSRQFFTEEAYLSILADNKFVHHDLSYGIPLADNSADFIYSSHFLEHLDRGIAKQLIAESFRVLRPNGVIRIGVPDLAYAWILYQRGEKERMLHDYFFIDGATGFSQHRYLYDSQMLGDLLLQCGFNCIQRTEFQQGITPDLVLLDNRLEYTLFMEAQKPNQSIT